VFQSYKALLDKRRESLLDQLEELHKQQELSVMEMFNEVNTTVDELEHGSKLVTLQHINSCFCYHEHSIISWYNTEHNLLGDNAMLLYALCIR